MKRTVMTGEGSMTYELIRTVDNIPRVDALPGGIVRAYVPDRCPLREADALVQREAARLAARLRLLDGPWRGQDQPDANRAKARLMERLALWHARIGGEYGAVHVRELGIKWGTCDREHNLYFSPSLALAPQEALDYVVIHELCHLHEFSHSERFWRMVKHYMPDYEPWKKWLSDHKRELMG